MSNRNLSETQFRQQHYPPTLPVERILPHLGDHAQGSPLVDEYAERMKKGEWDWNKKYAEPITLSGHAAEITGVSDGTHRTLAAHKAGLPEIPVEWSEVGWARQKNLKGTSYEDPASSPEASRVHRLRRMI